MSTRRQSIYSRNKKALVQVLLSVRLFSVCSFLWLMLMTQPVLGNIVGDIELLKLIADGYEVNMEKLRTWKGSASISGSIVAGEQQEEVIPSDFKKQWKDEVDFVLDRDIDAIRWNRRTIEGTEERQSKVTKIEPDCYGGITKGKYDYRMDHFKKGAGREKYPRIMFVRDKNLMPRNILSDTFDPLYILKEEIGQSNLPEKLKFYFEKADIFERTKGTVTRDGDVVTFEMVFKGEDTDEFGDIIKRYVFDLSKGCNIIEHSRKNALNERHWKLRYEKVAGVFIPKKISMTYENKRPSAKMVSKREAVLTTEMVNELVKPAEFEFDKIGLRHGDYIVDYIKGGIRYQWLIESLILDKSACVSL